MPTLDWIGKKAVLNHHREVPFHLLKTDAKLSVGDTDSGNLLVQGDNLLALKALLPYYAGKVKCIYIDPPYNTGNEDWVYNDAVNSPEMKNWLGKAVGAESEDLSRHDKWLCMMYPRLSLLRDFLTEDGVIFVSIDDNEEGSLRLLLDEIFGPQCFVAKLIWKSRQYLDSRSVNGISTDHEYIIVYEKTGGGIRFRGRERDVSKYSNPDNDPRGDWMSRSILGLATKEQRPNLHYDLIDPNTGISYPCAKNTGWRNSKETIAQKIKEGRILFPKKPSGRPREKVFLSELQGDFTGFASVIDNIYTAEGSHEIRDILGSQVFTFPKPTTLILELIRQVTKDQDIILDSFAGSGTTGHAVLDLNKQDGSARKFILAEMDEKICQNVTMNRLRKVIEGYAIDKNGKKMSIDGLGGGFRFCNLDEPLFDEFGNIRTTVTFGDLASHVYFSETGSPLPKAASAKSTLLGVAGERAVYLLYNGILGDKKPEGGNVLTGEVLRSLTPHSGPKVIYGEACRLGETRLRAEQITFKQTPYEIKVN
jgi:adenine-specific DNA-methyltransferase